MIAIMISLFGYYGRWHAFHFHTPTSKILSVGMARLCLDSPDCVTSTFMTASSFILGPFFFKELTSTKLVTFWDKVSLISHRTELNYSINDAEKCAKWNRLSVIWRILHVKKHTPKVLEQFFGEHILWHPFSFHWPPRNWPRSYGFLILGIVKI